MEDAAILAQLIKSSATVPLEDEYGKSVLTLREPQAPDSVVTVRNVPADTLAVGRAKQRNIEGWKRPTKK